MKILILLLLSFNAIAVDPAITPIVTIGCTMPIAREDGTPLMVEEIAYVTFYRGTTSGVYAAPPEENNICQLVVDASILPDNTYYYAVTATDWDGRESTYSNEFVLPVKRISGPSPPVCCTILS